VPAPNEDKSDNSKRQSRYSVSPLCTI